MMKLHQASIYLRYIAYNFSFIIGHRDDFLGVLVSRLTADSLECTNLPSVDRNNSISHSVSKCQKSSP
jgi:hypothetical protein